MTPQDTGPVLPPSLVASTIDAERAAIAAARAVPPHLAAPKTRPVPSGSTVLRFQPPTRHPKGTTR